MCGIAGLLSPEFPPTDGCLKAMIDTMTHRGPDGFGTFVDGAVGLAHRRLSIIDLTGGAQPMFNEDKSLALVFNGEIYDYVRHRDWLESKGHVFSTMSDSEVILHLYEEHGESMVELLNGMFAFAIYDVSRGSLFVARDRLGQKPLFYAHDGASFAFASGLAALTKLPWIEKDLDLTAINLFMELNCIPAPRTIFRKVRKLPPGHIATFEGGTLTIKPYWRPVMRPDSTLNYDDACAELRQTLMDAVERRLVADVPLGIFLSGGVDSSLICAIAAKCLDAPPKTYSIGFHDARYDERRYADLVASEIGCDHHSREVDPNSLSMLEAMIPRFEEPFADSSMLPTLLLSEFTANHVTVALSGDGADELFGGYYRYKAYHLFRRAGVVPATLRRLIANSGLALLPSAGEERTRSGKIGRLLRALKADGLSTYLGLTSRLQPHVRNLVLGDAFRDACVDDAFSAYSALLSTNSPSVDDIMTLDMETYLPDDILTKVDRSSMAHSLEVRSPFLDPAVVDLALKIPYAFKQKGVRRKRILHDAFRGLIPDEVFTRPKMGFGVPVGVWLRGAWKARSRELLLDGCLSRDGLFDPMGLERLLDEHESGRFDHSYVLFSLMVLEIWRQSFE